MLQIDTGTSQTGMTYGVDRDAMDALTNAMYWRNRAKKTSWQLKKEQQKMDKLVLKVIDHRFKSMMQVAEIYWKTYTGTVKAVEENERLRSRLEGLMNDNSLMNPGEKIEAKAHLKSHDELANQLRKEHQRLDDGNTPRVPSFYSNCELVSLE